MCRIHIWNTVDTNTVSMPKQGMLSFAHRFFDGYADFFGNIIPFWNQNKCHRQFLHPYSNIISLLVTWV